MRFDGKVDQDRPMTKIWQIVKDTVYRFIDDEALSRGAAIAFYTATSIAPARQIYACRSTLSCFAPRFMGAIPPERLSAMALTLKTRDNAVSRSMTGEWARRIAGTSRRCAGPKVPVPFAWDGPCLRTRRRASRRHRSAVLSRGGVVGTFGQFSGT
jgi:hypothetical protein